MHGNTFMTADKYKTRDYNTILEEIRITIETLKENSLHLAGIHLEMCHEYVTECIGGCTSLQSSDLKKKFTSACDPRLNFFQVWY
jgi:3-deoxy-7-phosphoheptulonate synthase